MLIQNEFCSGNVVAITLGESIINNGNVNRIEPTINKQCIDFRCVYFVEGGQVDRVGVMALYALLDEFVCQKNET